MTRGTCRLALEDGSVFTGRSFGALGTRTGEVCFNTSMAGYQEVLTDPSYRGQIVTITPSGRDIRARMWPIYSAALRTDVQEKPTDAEAEQLAELLGKLRPI